MTQTSPPQPGSLSQFESLLDTIQMQFDQVVESGSEQELFVSGYLSGHFSLVASQCCLTGMTSLPQLDEQLLASLDNAFANGELEAEDQKQVLTLWQNLVAQFS